MKKELVALVLAGGSGSRSWPLTTNKILFPFFGNPLFTFSVLKALPEEVSRIVIVTSKENNEYFKSLNLTIPIETVIQSEALGMADAVMIAESFIKGASILIMNGDDLHDGNLAKQVIRRAKFSKAFGVIPGWKTPYYMPLGYLRLDQDRILGIIEKPGPGHEPSNYANIVSHFIEDADILIQALKHSKSVNDDIYETSLTHLMDIYPFIMEPYMDSFASLKYPWHVLDILDILWRYNKSHRGNNVVIKDNVCIEGNVYIGDNVRIFENTKIIGPCYIGDNTIIGNNNIIRASHIGSCCVTGFNTDITRSYIGDRCWFHSNYIGDSVLESDISLGGGTNTMNLRLDEHEIKSVVKGERIVTGKNKFGCVVGKYVRVGGNTSIMPGIKIGEKSFIGAGIVLDEDVPNKHFCIAKKNYDMLPNIYNSQMSDRSDFLKKI